MRNLTAPVIPQELWETAKDRMVSVYKDSSNLALCLAILEAFSLTNKRKYRSDLGMFLHESNIEDFFTNDNRDIVVSLHLHPHPLQQKWEYSSSCAQFAAQTDWQTPQYFWRFYNCPAAHIFSHFPALKIPQNSGS